MSIGTAFGKLHRVCHGAMAAIGFQDVFPVFFQRGFVFRVYCIF